MSSKAQEQAKPEAQVPQLNGLEEDDEFEEFAAQGKKRTIARIPKHAQRRQCASADDLALPVSLH